MSIARDGEIEAIVISLNACAIRANKGRCSRNGVFYKNVRCVIRIAYYQIRSITYECHISTIRRDGRGIRRTITLVATATAANEDDFTCNCIFFENVPVKTRVICHEIIGVARKGHITAIGGNREMFRIGRYTGIPISYDTDRVARN